jgi:uncharacterized protein YjbI with pentapeptide repeats
MQTMAQAVICPQCSKKLSATATFCRRCGHRMQSPAQSSASRTAPAVKFIPPPSAAPQWAIGVAIVLVVAVATMVLLVIVRGGRSAPLATVPPLTSSTRAPMVARTPQLPPLPPIPPWSRHVPDDLPAPAAGATNDYRGQLLGQGRFLQGELRGAVFAGADVSQASFEKADLREADFRGAKLLQTMLAGADLAGARFDEAEISQSSLVSVDTAAVSGQTRVRNGITEPVPPPPLLVRNAGKATFRGTRINQVRLEGLDLAEADFSAAVFAGANFSNADLRGANFRDSRHTYSDFSGAKVDGADFCGADLSGAVNLTLAQLASARTDASTRMPRR